jgi:hypothetical protein
MDYLFSENGMLFHNLDFDVKVSPNQITISLPKYKIMLNKKLNF